MPAPHFFAATQPPLIAGAGRNALAANPARAGALSQLVKRGRCAEAPSRHAHFVSQ